jgi:Protein of unknown function (DUF3604)
VTETGWMIGASGPTGVWAEENTREALWDAMRRRETNAAPAARHRFSSSPPQRPAIEQRRQCHLDEYDRRPQTDRGLGAGLFLLFGWAPAAPACAIGSLVAFGSIERAISLL